MIHVPSSQSEFGKHYIENVLYDLPPWRLPGRYNAILPLQGQVPPELVRKCQHQGSRAVEIFTGIEEGSEELESLTEMRSALLANYESWG